MSHLEESSLHGPRILAELERARRFNRWLGDAVRPFIGDRVLEIGAGLGTLTSQLVPRETYVASDVDPAYLHALRAYALGKPYLRAMAIDAGKPDDFNGLEGRFDTVVMLNVLEHLPAEQPALHNVWAALEPGGRAVVLVPQHPCLYGSLDEALEHRARYTTAQLASALTAARFRVETIFDFNRVSVPAWWLNGRWLRRKTLSRLQLKLFDTAVPLLRRIDHLWPWGGLSIIGVAVKDASGRAADPR